MIDLEIIFAVLTFGCILFVLQTLVDYNKRAFAIRPQLNEVLRIKQHHKDEMDKARVTLENTEKEMEKHQTEIEELVTKHDELELKANQFRSQVVNKDDD